MSDTKTKPSAGATRAAQEIAALGWLDHTKDHGDPCPGCAVMAQIIAAAIAAEREACAKVAEAERSFLKDPPDRVLASNESCTNIAAAIRARGKR